MEIVNEQTTKQISNMNTTYLYTLERHEVPSQLEDFTQRNTYENVLL